eukprot:tig00000361_g24417.t1
MLSFVAAGLAARKMRGMQLSANALARPQRGLCSVQRLQPRPSFLGQRHALEHRALGFGPRVQRTAALSVRAAASTRAKLTYELPKIVGHRGAAAIAPENTLAGLRKAAELGCKMVEFDVKLTQDGRVILFHDHLLERTTDGKGDTRNLTLKEIRDLDAGSHFHADFESERVPTLEEALDEMVRLGLYANVELKPCAGTDEPLAAAALEVIARRWPRHLPPLLLSSFERASLAAAARISPETPRGLLLEEPPADWAEAAEALGCSTVHTNHLHTSDEVIAEATARGMPVLCYTVNSAREAEGLFRRGVASVFSDYPDLLRRREPATNSDAPPASGQRLDPPAAGASGGVQVHPS